MKSFTSSLLRCFHVFSLSAAMLASCPAGTVSTFAGTGEKGDAGDGGKATEAKLNNVFGIGRGPDGWLYICDTDNSRVRRVWPR